MKQEPNKPPNAVNDTASTRMNQNVEIDVLANDTDPNPGDMLTIVSATNSPNGTVMQGNTLYYIPKTNYSGTDTFTYTITDGKGGEATAQVTVTVQ